MTTDGYCRCGCGEKTTVPKYTNRSIGRFAGVPCEFITGHNGRVNPVAEQAVPFKIDGVYCRLITLTRGLYTIVDESDYIWLMQWKWHARKRYGGGFVACRMGPMVDSKWSSINMHDLIRCPPNGKTADHENRVSLDNRRDNLRDATCQQQVFNRGKVRTSKQPYKGVRKTPSGRWSASIKFNGKSTYLGLRDTAELAAEMYDSAAREMFGEFAYLNFP